MRSLTEFYSVFFPHLVLVKQDRMRIGTRNRVAACYYWLKAQGTGNLLALALEKVQVPLNDRVPEQPSDKLLSLFRALSLPHKNPRILTRQICTEIQETTVRQELFDIALDHGWPLKVDFEDSRERALELAEDFIELATDSSVLEDSVIDLPGTDQIQRPRLLVPDGTIFGRFGPKGRAIICSAVAEALEDAIHPDQIYQPVSSLINTPSPWDKPNTKSNLISWPKFIDCILAPHAAACLIAKDLDLDMSDILKVLNTSGDFGDAFHPTDRNFHRTPSAN
ncbi:hypothetical protein C8R46DRAFT_1226153 [Mycena filopes]|nr:hypothetical protein C8R46DRAFT_1226153 [Mycena filopes]